MVLTGLRSQSGKSGTGNIGTDWQEVPRIPPESDDRAPGGMPRYRSLGCARDG
jgi:hypothetical protein